MATLIALLRAVNVGGTGRMPMRDLKSLCEAEEFESVTTYIASGNVVFRTGQSRQAAREALERRLAAYAGKPVGVIVRTREEMADVVRNNPFSDVPASKVLVAFLNEAPAADALDHMKGLADEEAVLGKAEIYVYYPAGQGRSKLVIPAAKPGTARNMNTVAKLLDLAAALD